MPESLDSLIQHGRTCHADGDYRGAISAYTDALHLDPANPRLYHERGLVQYDRGDYPAALEDYNHALRLTPDAAFTYYCRALAAQELGDYASAIADYETYLATDNDLTPDDVEAVEAIIAALKMMWE